MGEDNGNNRDLYSGYLQKRGHIMKNWKRRWFVLRETGLCYFETAHFLSPKGVILLQGGSVKRKEGEEEPTFVISTAEGVDYYMKGSSEATVREWVENIQAVIENRPVKSTSSPAGGNTSATSTNSNSLNNNTNNNIGAPGRKNTGNSNESEYAKQVTRLKAREEKLEDAIAALSKNEDAVNNEAEVAKMDRMVRDELYTRAERGGNFKLLLASSASSASASTRKTSGMKEGDNVHIWMSSNHLYLCWDAALNRKEHPKFAIVIFDIMEVRKGGAGADGNDVATTFSIILYDGRMFVFRAPSSNVCDDWMKIVGLLCIADPDIEKIYHKK